jgi:hypothetical protein
MGAELESIKFLPPVGAGSDVEKVTSPVSPTTRLRLDGSAEIAGSPVTSKVTEVAN